MRSGRHQRCPGDSCPFWAGQGCALDGVRTDIETNPELAGYLLDLRASAAGVKGWGPFRLLPPKEARSKTVRTGGYHLPMLRLHYIPGTAAMAPHAALAEAGADTRWPWSKRTTAEGDPRRTSRSIRGDRCRPSRTAISSGPRRWRSCCTSRIASPTPASLPLSVRGLARSSTVALIPLVRRADDLHALVLPQRFTTSHEGAAAIRDRVFAAFRRHNDWIDGCHTPMARRRGADRRRPVPLHAHAVGALSKTAGVGFTEPAHALRPRAPTAGRPADVD